MWLGKIKKGLFRYVVDMIFRCWYTHGNSSDDCFNIS